MLPPLESTTDSYFTRTKRIVELFGDIDVVYAVFMRRPVVSAPKMAVDFIEAHSTSKVDVRAEEGQWVGAGDPLLHITGPFSKLVELETMVLQKIGAASVAAYNAAAMCASLPRASFLAMGSRHCAGEDMAELMAYAASVGSRRAQKLHQACGFTGTSNTATAHFFGQDQGVGTMPHALVGYAGSTVRAAEMFHEVYPEAPLVVLVDYFGAEITDALDVCHRFPHLAEEGSLGVRLDTVGSRYCEGLDPMSSYAVLDRTAPEAIRGYLSEPKLHHLVGPGVSAAAVWHLRERLNKEGFPRVFIVGSSGFDPLKCQVMSLAHAPVDYVGTGSYLPQKWEETYATADIIRYGSTRRVKVGREFLLRSS